MSLPFAPYGCRLKYFEPVPWNYLKIYLNFGMSRSYFDIISSLTYEFHIPYYLKLILRVTTLVALQITNLFIFFHNQKFLKIFLFHMWEFGGDLVWDFGTSQVVQW